MAGTARVSQSAIEFLSLPPANARVSQSVIEFIVFGTVPPPPAPPAPIVVMAGSSGARFKPCLDHGSEWIAANLAEKLRVQRSKRSAWPYDYLFPIEQSIPVNALDDLEAPPQDGNLYTILQYQVAAGFRFWMDAAILDCPRPFLPGDFQFVVDVNSEVTGSTQASRVQGLVSLPVPLGSFASGEVWRFPMPYLFEPLTVIRFKVMNNNLNPGPPNAFTAGAFGFLVPWVQGDL